MLEGLAVSLVWLMDAYGTDHEGPDIGVVTTTGRSVVEALASLRIALVDVDMALAIAEERLEGLAAASEALWVSAHALQPMAPEVDPGSVERLDARFAEVRADEDDVYRRLEVALADAPSGMPVELDAAGVAEVIGREAGSLFFGETVRSDLLPLLRQAGRYERDGRFDLMPLVVMAGLVQAGADPGTIEDLTVADRTFVTAVLAAVDDPANDFDDVDAVLAAVTEAMVEGSTPERAGLASELFPESYVVLQRAVTGAAVVDQDEQVELASGIGAELRRGRYELSPGAAAVAMMEVSGTERLWVRLFARALADQHLTSTARDDLVGLQFVAPVIAGAETHAVLFFNELGAEGAALLPSMYLDGNRPTYELLGDALGLAADSSRLGFDGAEFVRSALGSDVVASPLNLLAVSDEIPDRFLVDATAESLRLTGDIDFVHPDAYAMGEFVQPVGYLMGNGPYADNDAERITALLLEQGDDFDFADHLLRYGSPDVDANLVMLSMIADRPFEVTFDLLMTLGSEHADALLRYDPNHGRPPPNWPPPSGMSDLAAALWRVADPNQTGDQALSDRAARWILEGAATPAPDAEVAVRYDVGQVIELILIQRPTLLADDSGLRLEQAGIERPAFDGSFDDDMIGTVVEAVFRSEDGDRRGGDALLTFQNGLIRDVVLHALAEGDGDPTAIGDVEWLGEVFARIDAGAEQAEIAAATEVDARNDRIHSYLGTAAEALGAWRIPGGDTLFGGALGDQTIGFLLGLADDRGRFLPTDHEARAWQNRWMAEDYEPKLIRMMLLRALVTEGRIELPPGVTLDDYALSDAILPNDLPVLDSDGNEVVVDGEPVTFRDWRSVFIQMVDAMVESEWG